MADIFISYARTDRARIEKLARALEAAGLAVWWDHRIDAGSEFTKDIERELRAAKAVIVAWSAAGAASPWVRDEASLAKTLGTLLPIRLDAEGPPLGFQQFHAFDFSGWRGEAEAEEFATLLASVRRRIAGEAATPFDPPAAAAPPGLVALRKYKVLALAGAAAALVAVLALALFVFRATPPPEATDGEAEITPADQSQAAAKGDGDVATGGAPGGVGLAVLPFANLSSDPEQEHFADGLTEELLNWLGNVEGLKVPGRTTSFQYKGKADDLRAIGAALGVDYVLEGSVRRSGDALRITAQLIEAKTGYHLWSETYDRKLVDIFVIQDEVARIVVTELLGKIPESGAANPAAVGDVDPRAHELYLEGRALWGARGGWKPAFEKFREATLVDPRHALAQAYLAVVAANAIYNGSSFTGFEKNREAVVTGALAEAVKFKPQAADVLFAQGWVAEMLGSGEAGTSITNPAIVDFYERAVRANPRHVEALHALARAEPAGANGIKLYERILEIDPAHAAARGNLLNILIESGDLIKAGAVARQSLTLAPDARGPVAEAGKRLGDMALVGEALFARWDMTERVSEQSWTCASVLASLGAVTEARYLFARAADVAHPPFRQLARVNVAILERDAAAELQFAEEMHRLDPAPLLSASARLASALIRTGEPERAYDVLLARQPGLAEADASKWGEAFAIESLTAGHALALAGRRAEARALWQAALAAVEARPAAVWGDYLDRALLNGNLGDRAAAISNFQAAYESGFRYLWSYESECYICVYGGFYDEYGLFAELMKIPEIAAIVKKIEADNAKTLEAFNAKYGILDNVRAMMAAEQAAAKDGGR